MDGLKDFAEDAPLLESQAIMFLWQHIEALLSSPKCISCASVGLLSEALPALQTIPAHALSGLVDLHLRSSADLMHTIRLILPQAFSSGSASPDLWTLGPMHSSVVGVLSNVMLLQNFHLNRAVALAAEMRLRIASKEQSQQGGSTQGGSMQGLVSSSSGSSGSSGSSRATDSWQQPLQRERQQLQLACDLQRQLQLLQLQTEQTAAGSGASSGNSPPYSLLSFTSQYQAREQQQSLFMPLQLQQQQQQQQMHALEEQLACPLAVPQAPCKPLKERLQLQSQVDELQAQAQAAVQVQVQSQAHTETLRSLQSTQPPVPVAPVQVQAETTAQGQTPAARDRGAHVRAAGAVTSRAVLHGIVARAQQGQLAPEGRTAQAQTHPKPQRVLSHIDTSHVRAPGLVAGPRKINRSQSEQHLQHFVWLEKARPGQTPFCTPQPHQQQKVTGQQLGQQLRQQLLVQLQLEMQRKLQHQQQQQRCGTL